MLGHLQRHRSGTSRFKTCKFDKYLHTQIDSSSGGQKTFQELDFSTEQAGAYEERAQAAEPYSAFFQSGRHQFSSVSCNP